MTRRTSTSCIALLGIALAACPYRAAPRDVEVYDGPARDPDERRVALVLYDVWGAHAGDAWAVGDNGVVVHWNGDRWHVLRYRAPGHLYGVWGARADDVWAVGAGGVAVHWDGARWSSVESGTRANLRAVWGASGAEVWAVGDAGTIVRWRGGAAARAESVAVEGAGDASAASPAVGLDDIAGSAPDDAWAVGEAGTVLRWNGARWTRFASGTTAALRGVWFANAREGWIVGAPDEAADGPIAEAVALHWDGARLTSVRTGTREPLSAVWGSAPNDVWAVGHNFGRGYDGPRRQIVRWDGNAWAPRSWGASGWYAGVWGAGAGDVWAVGCCESILRWTPGGWVPLTFLSKLVPPPAPLPIGSSFRRPRKQS